jgi:hypothetical protein
MFKHFNGGGSTTAARYCFKSGYRALCENIRAYATDAPMLDAKQQFILQSVSLRLPSVAYAKEIYSNLVKRNLLLLPDVESRAAT